MSDRAPWLQQWCPERHAASGHLCTLTYGTTQRSQRRAAPSTQLEVARGWFERPYERPYPTCKAAVGERCSIPTGGDASRMRTVRLRPGRFEVFWRPKVCEELERRGVTAAVVRFLGGGDRGARTEWIKLLRLEGEEVVQVERWTGGDELCYALEAPAWDRFGLFAGRPLVSGEMTRSAEDRTARDRGSAWRPELRGARGVSAPSDRPASVMFAFPRRRARGPPAQPRLRSAKDRAATRSSRASAPSAPHKNHRSVYAGGGRTRRGQRASAALAGRASPRASQERTLAMALSHDIARTEARSFRFSLRFPQEPG